MEIRLAQKKDLCSIVSLLCNDSCGFQLDSAAEPLADCYAEAFERIQSSDHSKIIVADHNHTIAACLQLTIIPHLSHRGGIRAQIESLRVHENYRSQNTGKLVVEWAIDLAREQGCYLVQVSTNKGRRHLLKFFQSMGFESTHEGVKLYLEMEAKHFDNPTSV